MCFSYCKIPLKERKKHPNMNSISIVVLLGSVLYVYLGGRLTISVAILVLYDLLYSHHVFKPNVDTSKSDNDTLQTTPGEKPKKHKCCGGKGGSGCCSNKSGSKSSCKCGHKKNKNVTSDANVENETEFDAPIIKKVASLVPKERSIDNSVDENVALPIAVDFTQTFKKKSSKKKKITPKKFTNTNVNIKNSDSDEPKVLDVSETVTKSTNKPVLTTANDKLINSQICIFYSSLQGASEQVATRVHDIVSKAKDLKYPPSLIHLDEIDDLDDFFINIPSEDDSNRIYLLVLPSYDTDCPLDYFLQTLQETYYDHRMERYPLSKLTGFTVLGLGDNESWPEKFCYQAKTADRWLSKLGGRRIFPLGQVCMKTEGYDKVDQWTNSFTESLYDDEPIVYQLDESDDDDDIIIDEDIQDVEDLVNPKDEVITEIKQMVAKNSPTYNKLTKQGYTIVGSHSGVKICRWAKSDLRGTGSCYKQSLFNIVSSRCMELTPSLACSSKCVFCWRHGTNPVSKTWRWEVDDPEYILKYALEGHYRMIKQMRGVPGVIAERFEKAFQVRHCALSLVGEPIMYPYINRFVELLHKEGISSFLVCNAQHPEPLEKLGKVTQLYVSIDAPTKDELKKVDRPLFKDYWERMLQCLDILRTTQSHQRTVFRLTLVKAFNMDSIPAYCDLVEKGQPCFIEVKGATFSGTFTAGSNPLTMQNIPYYEECTNFVKEFVKELQRRGLDYDAAAEHAHSNCILIANKKFKINNEWHTHIDFEKYFELVESGEHFTHMDYMAKTPEWALFGNGGFAPGNTRVHRKGKKKKEQKQQAAADVETKDSEVIESATEIVKELEETLPQLVN